MLTTIMAEISNINILTFVGYFLLIVGVFATALSSQRYLLVFTFIGMCYWSLIEILQAGLTTVFALSSWHGYVVALMLSWLPVASWVMYRSLHPVQKQKARALARAKYIEHTPVYKNYQPKFQ